MNRDTYPCGTAQAGIALMPVVFTLAILAAAAFLTSREGMVALAVTRGEAIKVANDMAADSVLARAKWELMHSGCSIPAAKTGLAYGEHSFDVDYSGTMPNIEISTTLHVANGAKITRKTPPITVYDYLQPRQLTLQPDAGDSEDTYIEGQSGHTDHNKGSDTELSVESRSNQLKRTLLKFGLLEAPDNIDLSSAVLELYQSANSGSALTINVHRVTRHWNETEVTWEDRRNNRGWNTEGGDYTPAVSGSFVADTNDTWRSANITELVEYWLENPVRNRGMILTSNTSADSKEKKFRSSSHNQAGLRPKLTLNYLCECGQTCAAGTVVQDIKLSADSKAELGGTTFFPTDIVWYRGPDSASRLLFDGTSQIVNSRISAFHQLANNNYTLAFSSPVNIGGISVMQGDIIEYDSRSQTAYMRFKARDHNFYAGINSVYTDDTGNLLFSANGSGNMYGLNFSDRDLIAYNRTTMTPSLELRANDHDYDRRITAVHKDSDDSLILAFENDFKWGDHKYQRGSLVRYDTATRKIAAYFDGARFGDSNSISSVHTGPPSGAFPLLEIAHWEFNDKNEEPAIDRINSLAAASLGSPGRPEWVPGGNNGAMRFDGVNDGMTVADHSLLDMASEFTLSAYVHLDTSVNGKNFAIVSKENSSRNNGYAMTLEGQELVLRVQGNSYSANTTITVGAWHHFAVVFDRNKNQVSLYQNGDLLKLHSNTVQTVGNAEPLRIGYSAGNAHLQGVIDDVKLYREALDLNAIRALYKTLPQTAPDVKATSTPEDNTDNDSDSNNQAWACNGSYRDNFSKAESTSSNGSIDWSSLPAVKNDFNSWGNFFFASVGIFDGALWLRNANKYYARRTDLSGAKQAYLSYDYRRDEVDFEDEQVTVYVSTESSPSAAPSSSSSDWIAVATHKGGVKSEPWQPHVIDISEHISSSTWIAFRTSNTYEFGDRFWIDYINVNCSTAAP